MRRETTCGFPSIFNNDLAFFKNVPIGEKREIQLRWEIYNIFNHTNFRDIDGTMTFGLVQVKPNANDPLFSNQYLYRGGSANTFEFWNANQRSRTAHHASVN